MKRNRIEKQLLHLDGWYRLAARGDEWLIAYASLPVGVAGVQLFSVGHAVELYLKAIHTKLFGDIDKAIRYGHRLKDLWDSCKKHGKAFMPGYEIRETIYSQDFLDAAVFQSFSKDDQRHLISHYSLYLVFKHLQDLKYLGLPWKTREAAPFFIGQFYPDPFWPEFFVSLRNYIDYPPDGKGDFLRVYLACGCLPGYVRKYLKEFINKKSKNLKRKKI